MVGACDYLKMDILLGLNVVLFAGRWVGGNLRRILVVVPCCSSGVAFASIPCILESFFWRIWSGLFGPPTVIEFVTFFVSL